MKKNIILSLVLFISLAMTSVYGQDENSTETTEDSIEGSVNNLFGPKKGDFTAELLFGKGHYLNSLNQPTDVNGVVYPNTPSAIVSGNYNDAVNMIGLEVGYYIGNRWALTLSGGTILSNTPSQVGIPAAGNLPAYAAVAADENIDVNVTLGVQYLFKTESKKLFPYIGVGVPYNYARRSFFDPTIDVNNGTITDLGVGHTETSSVGIQAVAGVDYYFTDEIFLGARIVPMAFNYAYSSKLPAPGLPVLEVDNTSASFFVQPTISLGYNLGRKDRDKDGDGVLDKDDNCPDVPGEVNGCPYVEEKVDTDGDGITDDIDRCPYNAGSSKTWGCPDYDNDGVLDLDENDKCPGVAGPKENNGCPWPDSDGDGVLDNVDKCINVPGSKDNDGCPLIDKRASTLIDSYAREILFDTAKSSFQNGVTAQLNEIASIMNNYPKANFLIQGHTDNIGTTESNQALSVQRVNAVLNYLVNSGNVSSSRLVSEGKGELSPAYDNSTSEGRKLNRRVLVIVTNN